MSDFGTMMSEKCLNFAVRIVNLCKFLKEEKRENRMSDQLFRSGTSIGANFFESQCAISRNDLVAKVLISLKECNESLYWLLPLHRTGVLTQSQFSSIYNDCEEIKKMLVSIAKTSRENANGHCP